MEGVGPKNRIKFTTYRIHNTPAAKTHVHKITNVPVFYMALGLNDFDGGESTLGPLEGLGHENLNFLGPTWHWLCLLPFQGPKKY